jgi:hypothetical protein
MSVGPIKLFDPANHFLLWSNTPDERTTFDLWAYLLLGPAGTLPASGARMTN